MCVPGSTPAIAVLATMYRTHISGVAITDDQGKLIGNLSVSDVRGLRAQRYVGSKRVAMGWKRAALKQSKGVFVSVCSYFCSVEFCCFLQRLLPPAAFASCSICFLVQCVGTSHTAPSVIGPVMDASHVHCHTCWQQSANLHTGLVRCVCPSQSLWQWLRSSRAPHGTVRAPFFASITASCYHIDTESHSVAPM